MKFSICVPVYNVEKYLCECVDSVLAQTYQNFELILVDDGSRDDSGKICEEYAIKDERIKVYHKENEGQIMTRSFAIEKAVGEFLIFLDSDDALEKNALQVLCEVIHKYKVDCVIYNYRRFEDGTYFKPSQVIEEVVLIEDKRELYKKILSDDFYNSMCIKAVRHSIINNKDYVEYANIRYGEDLLQSIDILYRCKSVLFIPDILYNYRINPTSVTHTIHVNNYKVDYTIREKILDFLEKEKLFNEDDMKEYHIYSLKLLIQRIMFICSFKSSYRQIKKKLNEIKETKYYKEFLCIRNYERSKIGFRVIILDLFHWNLFGIIILYMKLSHFIKSKLRFIKSRKIFLER